MDAWIAITIAAACAQTLRFMAQRHLKKTSLSTSGATLSRFIYSAPIAAAGIAIYLAISQRQLPALSFEFWSFALLGGLSQILATLCVVAIFATRNFAVGMSLKKTEVLLTAIVGFMILGDTVTPAGALALCFGFVAVLFLSRTPAAVFGADGVQILDRSAGLGLASGLLFALSAIGYRGAVLALGDEPVAFRAALTLAIVTIFQTLAMAAWMRWREPGEITAVLKAWRIAGLVGILSMLGSFGWFAAFALQNAAYVFALGQIELIFSICASVLFFGERITRREYAGMALLTGSIIVLVAVA